MMRITAEISLYPLKQDFVIEIKEFITALRAIDPTLEIVTNQMSTQLRGEFDAVTGAISRCMRDTMAGDGTSVFVIKYLSADLDIGNLPKI